MFLPGPADVDFYAEHGWYVAPVLLSSESLQILRSEIESFVRYGPPEATSEPLAALIRQQAESAHPQLMVRDYIALVSPLLRSIVGRCIAPVAGTLAVTDQIRLFASGVVRKAPGATPRTSNIGWHTDRAYWQMCSSTRMLTAWIPMQDVSAATGTLTVIDGSHNWTEDAQLRDLRLRDSFLDPDHRDQWARLKASERPITPVALEMIAGQVSFHNCLTLHSSAANTGTIPRVAVTCHFQDHANRYVQVRRPDGGYYSHKCDTLARRLPSGEPDYSDPTTFPVLWSRLRSGLNDALRRRI